MEMFHRSPSYGVYISKLIRFARVCSNVDDFINRNLFLTAKLLKQGYRYHKTRKAFSKFYHRCSELIVKYNIRLKTVLQQGISKPIFYGDLVYKFKRIVGKPNFSDNFTLIQYFGQRPLSRKNMHFSINYIVSVPPFCICFLETFEIIICV